MTRNSLRWSILLVASLLLCAVSLALLADEADRLAQETGLDRDLINVIEVDNNGTSLVIVFVYINERTFQSKISPALYQALHPYIGQHAIYVNPTVETVVDRFDFQPLGVSATQDGGGIPATAESWIEITQGFMSGAFVVNPGGVDKGSGSEGILVLGDALDEEAPFDVHYLGQTAHFEIADASAVASGATAPIASSSSHDPIDVAPLGSVDTLEEILLSDEFSQEAMAALFGLPMDLVRVMVLSGGGQGLRLFYVLLEDRVRDSLLGDELLATVDPLIGTGAVMVWALSPSGAPFSPWHLYIQQHGTNYVFFSVASFVELTEGFLRVEDVQPEEVVAGVIRLPKGVDATAAFSVFYGTSGVDYP